MTALRDAGVAPLDFDGLEQDGLGIWSAPGGSRVAWFKDPDGNTLSLTQFASGAARGMAAPPTAMFEAADDWFLLLSGGGRVGPPSPPGRRESSKPSDGAC